MKKLLFDIIPSKVTIGADAAPLIVATLRGLLTFAERELGAREASKCLAALEPNASERLARELGNERNFGMAKSLIMQGMRAGFDLTSEAGVAAFVEHVNRNGGVRKPSAKPKTKAKAKATSSGKTKVNAKTSANAKTNANAQPKAKIQGKPPGRRR
jgi:hypothetical protein